MKRAIYLGIIALLICIIPSQAFFFEFGNENQTTFRIDDTTGRVVSSDSSNASYMGFDGDSIDLSLSGTNYVRIYPSDDAYTLNDTAILKGQNFNTNELLSRKEISSSSDYTIQTNISTPVVPLTIEGEYPTGGFFYASVNITPEATPVSAQLHYTMEVTGLNNINLYCKEGASTLNLLDALIGYSNATYGSFATINIPLPQCLLNGKVQLIVTGHANAAGESSLFKLRNFTYERENSLTKLAGFYLKFNNMSAITDDMTNLNLESAELFMRSTTFSEGSSAVISAYHVYANTTWNETNISFRQQPCGARPILSNNSGCNTTSLAVGTFLEGSQGKIGITDLFREAMRKNESNVSLFLVSNTSGDNYFYSRNDILTSPYLELRFTNRSVARVKLNNGSSICTFDSVKTECSSNFSVPNAYDFIGPQQISDVDDEDIEGDLNTYVDVAGDTITGDINFTGSYMKFLGNLGIGVYPVGGLSAWPTKSIILNSTGTDTEGAIFFYDQGGTVNSRLYGTIPGIDLTGGLSGPRGLITYVFSDTFEDAQPIFKIMSSGGAAANTSIYGDLYLNSYTSTGKVLCVKTSDGKIGTCSSVVGAGGTCTCA